MTWLIPITLLVAVCALVGGLIARQVYAATRPPAGAPSSTATSEGPTTTPARPSDWHTVVFTDFAQTYPDHLAVQSAIQNYFNAVNDGNYDLWRRTMTAAIVETQTEQSWRNGSSSSKDTNMIVYRIEATDQGVDVFGSFTSTQSLAQAPKDLQATCINWAMVWPMQKVGNGYLIDGPSVIKKKCDA